MEHGSHTEDGTSKNNAGAFILCRLFLRQMQQKLKSQSWFIQKLPFNSPTSNFLLCYANNVASNTVQGLESRQFLHDAVIELSYTHVINDINQFNSTV